MTAAMMPPPYFAYHPSVSVLTVAHAEIDSLFLSQTPQTPLNLLAFLHTYHTLVDSVVAEFSNGTLWKHGSCSGSYQVTSGVLTDATASHTEILVKLSQRLKTACSTLTLPDGQPLKPSFSIHTGDAVSGVLGNQRLDYEIVGSVVQVSRALAELVPPSCVVITQQALDALPNRHEWQPCGSADVCVSTFQCFAYTNGRSFISALLCRPPKRTITLLQPPEKQLVPWDKNGEENGPMQGPLEEELVPASCSADYGSGARGPPAGPRHNGPADLHAVYGEGRPASPLEGPSESALLSVNPVWLNFADDHTDKAYLTWLAENAYLTDVLALLMRTAFNLSAALQSGQFMTFLVPLLCSLVPLYLAVAFRTWYLRRRIWVLMAHGLAACLCAAHVHSPAFVADAEPHTVASTTGLFKATGADTVMFNVILQLPFRQHFLLQLLSVALLVPLVPATCIKAAAVIAAGDHSACMLLVAAGWHFGVAGLFAAALSYVMQSMYVQRFQEETNLERMHAAGDQAEKSAPSSARASASGDLHPGR